MILLNYQNYFVNTQALMSMQKVLIFYPSV